MKTVSFYLMIFLGLNILFPLKGESEEMVLIPENWYSPFLILVGKWQIKGKEQFEEWRFDKENRIFIGESYKTVDGSKLVLETLTIRKVDDKVIYTAVVPTQNEGKSIDFTWNPELTDRFSFENPDHDFPNKIQYQLVNANILEVQVSDNNHKGFSLTLVKVE